MTENLDSERRETEKATGKSLIVLSPHERREWTGSRISREPRTLATFVTQLIAKAQDAPHLRERRRAEPAEAINAYGRMLNLGGVPGRHK